jgi:hypothetical protein
MHQVDSSQPVSMSHAACGRLKRVLFRLLQAARRPWRAGHHGAAATPGMAAEAFPFADTQAQWKELSAALPSRRVAWTGRPTRLKEPEHEN